MALEPQFVAIDRLKTFSVVNENLDTKLLQPSLMYVQQGFLRQIIGKDLYNELKTQLNASSVTVLNATLLNDYIEPYLINKCVANCLIDITFKLRNKALQTMGSDFSQTASLNDLSKMQGQYEQRAETFKTLLMEYLCENGSDYPLYCPKSSSLTNNSSGIFLGNVRPKRRYTDPEKDCTC